MALGVLESLQISKSDNHSGNREIGEEELLKKARVTAIIRCLAQRMIAIRSERLRLCSE